MNFGYYYGSEADLFSFIRIPRIMLTDSMFAPLSLQAKVLYSVLLDRMSLSRKNGWFDDKDRVFIIYQIGEIQSDLGFSKKKAMELLTELETFGLVEKKRRGHGLPNILYVKSFMQNVKGTEEGMSMSSKPDYGNMMPAASGTSLPGTGKNILKPDKEIHPKTKGAETGTTDIALSETRNTAPGTSKLSFQGIRSIENDSSGVPFSVRMYTCNEEPGNIAEIRNAEIEIPGDSRSAEIGTSAESRSTGSGTLEVPKSTLLEVPDSTLLEVPKSAPLKNKTDMNNTYWSNTESNHISSAHLSASGFDAGQAIRSDDDEMRLHNELAEADYGSSSAVKAYSHLIRKNIAYEDLLIAHPDDSEFIKGIADLILDTVLCSQEYIVIASNRFPSSVVRSRFLKLNYLHIEYVLTCLRKNTSKVGNIRKYLLAALYNAPVTMDGYYRAEVNYGQNSL